MNSADLVCSEHHLVVWLVIQAWVAVGVPLDWAGQLYRLAEVAGFVTSD